MAQKVTIKDLAKELNVSAMTVSRALRGAPDISRETKQAVLDLAKRRHYRPNAIATSLSSQKSYTLGVIVPDISRHFFSKMLRGIEAYAQTRKYKVLICQTDDDYQKEVSDLETLVGSRVDGIIAAISRYTQDMAHFKEVQELGIPLVLADRVHPEFRVSKVVSDDYHGAAVVTQHLIEQGYRRIAHLTCYPQLFISQQRLRGYQDTLARYNLPIDESLILETDPTVPSGREATERLLAAASPPDGIFSMVDLVGIGAILAARDRGVSVPNQLAVAGFGNEDVSAWIDPSLTTIEQFPYEIGKASSELLLAQMGPDTETVQVNERTIETQLIVRQSSLLPGE